MENFLLLQMWMMILLAYEYLNQYEEGAMVPVGRTDQTFIVVSHMKNSYILYICMISLHSCPNFNGLLP